MLIFTLGLCCFLFLYIYIPSDIVVFLDPRSNSWFLAEEGVQQREHRMLPMVSEIPKVVCTELVEILFSYVRKRG